MAGPGNMVTGNTQLADDIRENLAMNGMMQTALSHVAVPSGPPVDVIMPAEQTLPAVFASPHSGAEYPPEFVAQSRLQFPALRRSEDSFVDELFASAPDFRKSRENILDGNKILVHLHLLIRCKI